MLDVNLHTLNFVRSTNEPDKLFMIDESTGDPAYFRSRVPEGSETRIELYHAPTLAPLGVFQHLSSKLKLISLTNPATTVELKSSGYINFEWTFYFDRILKFCWKKDIVGLAGNKRGFTCWMSRKPDPDYPCAIYKPASSTVPPFCQFLDFNIRRIDGLQDPRGLKYVILLSLLSFTEAPTDHEMQHGFPTSPTGSLNKAVTTMTLKDTCEANELRISGHRSISELVTHGLKLFEDPLLLYLSVYASSQKEYKQATNVAEQIKHDRLKKAGEHLYQYLVDDVMCQQNSGPSIAQSSTRLTSPTPKSLRVYLSRTPLDELLPQSTVKTTSEKPTKSSLSTPASSRLVKSSHHRPLSSAHQQRQGPPASLASGTPTNHSLHSKLITSVHRPFSKMMSIASNSSRSNALALSQNQITPYHYLDEKEETMPEIMVMQDEKYQDSIPITQPLRLPRYSGAYSKQDHPSINQSHDPPEDILYFKKSDPFSIRTKELNVTNHPIHRSRATAKNGTKNNPVGVGITQRPLSLLNPSSNEQSQSSDGDIRNISKLKRSSASIRSRSSTIKSTASSFVEIILSSCCSAYTAFNGSTLPNEEEIRRNFEKNILRHPQSPTTSTWKRFSNIGGRHSLVPQLFKPHTT